MIFLILNFEIRIGLGVGTEQTTNGFQVMRPFGMEYGNETVIVLTSCSILPLRFPSLFLITYSQRIWIFWVPKTLYQFSTVLYIFLLFFSSLILKDSGFSEIIAKWNSIITIYFRLHSQNWREKEKENISSSRHALKIRMINKQLKQRIDLDSEQQPYILRHSSSIQCLRFFESEGSKGKTKKKFDKVNS